jgi:pre-mRNA-splicing factor CWC22
MHAAPHASPCARACSLTPHFPLPLPLSKPSSLPCCAAITGGTYVPPFKMERMRAELGDDRVSPEYQRLSWEALKKSLNGIINKVNITNIKAILLELFREVCVCVCVCVFVCVCVCLL